MSLSLLEEIAGTGTVDAYDLLPESIKGYHSRRDWEWMSDQQKQSLVATECEPEKFED